MNELQIKFASISLEPMENKSKLPVIIQGGMGVGVSSWQLASSVSQLNQLGVVSGTGLNTVLIRNLQDGDQGGQMRRALAHFPDQAVVKSILQTYFNPEGRKKNGTYKLSPLPSLAPNTLFQHLSVLGSFVEVFLAKEGHSGIVGINFLEKLQTSNLSGIYGAMLAKVDYILMGAGIPREIPGVIDHFTKNEAASLRVPLSEARSGSPEILTTFNPQHVFPDLTFPALKKPKFLAIISSSTLATHLARKTVGTIDGFVVEASSAGGHNAPPRGVLRLSEKGEPIYGEKDHADLNTIKALGLPFWLAGSFGSHEKLLEAQATGAVGIQVGTAFAFCEESGISEKWKKATIAKWATPNEPSHDLVFTDPSASPTDFQFKVAPLVGTLSDPQLYTERPRKCDLGYLRQITADATGKIVYRCPSEPIHDYLKKGGKEEDTKGRKCLCNALMANIGIGQTQANDYHELPLITAGDDLIHIQKYIKPNHHSYRAQDVISYLLGDR